MLAGVGLAAGSAANREKKPKSFRQIGLEIGCSPTQAQKYVDKGMPRDGKAREKWLEAYRKRVSEPSGKRQEANSRIRALEEELLQEKIARARYQRRKMEGELVERRAVENRLRRQITDARVQLEAIPAVVAAFIPEGDGRESARERVANIIDKVLEGLASGK